MQVEPDSILNAASSITNNSQSNSTETGAISFLIQAASQLDGMDSDKYQNMMKALDRMVGLIELSIGSSAPPSAIHSLIPASATTSIPPPTNIPISSDSRSSFSLTVDPIDSTSTASRSRPTTHSILPPIVAKGVNIREESEQEDRSVRKKVNKALISKTLKTAAMIGLAIESTPAKRATRKQISEYILTHFSLAPQCNKVKMKHRLDSTLTGRTCFENMNIGPNGPAKIGCYWRIVEGISPGPFDDTSNRLRNRYSCQLIASNDKLQPEARLMEEFNY